MRVRTTDREALIRLMMSPLPAIFPRPRRAAFRDDAIFDALAIAHFPAY